MNRRLQHHISPLDIGARRVEIGFPPARLRRAPWVCLRLTIGFGLGLLSVLTSAHAAAPMPIRVGEINSYSGIAASVTQRYRQSVEMAVDEVNATGGLLGRKVEVLFRDDKGDPAEALKQARALVTAAHVHLLAGTSLSHVGLAVSEFAKARKVLFVAAGPPSEALTGSRGHRYTFRVRPNTRSQARMLAERAARLPYRKWAVIGSNSEDGRQAWESFWTRLKALQPAVQVVGEHWPTPAKEAPGASVTALLRQHPEALYVALVGSDWVTVAREAGARGLFRKVFTVGIGLGEPEYLDLLKTEAPEGMLVTGYPWDALRTPWHHAFATAYTWRTGHAPGMGALLGYVTFQSLFAAIRKAQSTDTDTLVRTLESLTVETPIGPITYRASDHQSTMGAWVGMTKLDRARGVAVMVPWEYVPGERVLPSPAEVRRLRAAMK